MKNRLNFSVLIAVYHKEKADYFDSALDSIINQTLIPNEIVIVKDGPLTPELEEVINQYIVKYPALFKIVELEKNSGLGIALQVGLKECTYEVVARMDSDDISKPNRFEKQIDFLIKNDDIDILGTYIDEFSNTPSIIDGTRKVPLNHVDIYKFGKYRNPMNHVSVIFRKKPVLQAGSYIPFLYQEDYYLWIRLLLQGAKFANIPESLILVRGGIYMQQRRGGLNYLKNEISFHFELKKLGYLNLFEFIRNSIIRIVFRSSGKIIRQLIYKLKLRS